MTRALMVRSIPLSRVTRDAWKAAGAMFARRDSTPERIRMLGESRTIINLGGSNMNIEGMWNNAPDIAPLLTPMASRAKLDNLMPTNRWYGMGSYWLKGQGRGGANKEKVLLVHRGEHNDLLERAAWMNGDVQYHIEGNEYRVITVGTKVVQGMTRVDNADGERAYVWTGVNGLPSTVKEIARKAAMLMNHERLIVGWDVIEQSMDRAYILEGNSCPGVNEATANRILDAVEGVQYEAA